MAFKIKAFLTRKPGMSPAAFRAHYEERHVPLALATFPEIIRHQRNYVAPEGMMFPPQIGMPQWDAVSDIWFADRAGFDAMLARLGTPATAAVAADEAMFLDRDRCGMMIVEEVDTVPAVA